MKNGFPRARRSPDRHSSDQHPPDEQCPSIIEQGEWYSRGYLPHRDGKALTQHVSVHLADSLPRSAVARIDLSIKLLPEDQRKIARRKKLEAWIDAGHGSCLLQKPAIASMVQNSLLHFHDKRYYLHAWVVMPNHFHALFQPFEDWPMAKIVSSWKKFTGRKIGDYLRSADREIGAPGTQGIEAETDSTNADREIGAPGDGRRSLPVWHREFWDRYIRDEEHYWDTVEYIHNNPVKAGLVKNQKDWPWSSAAFDK